MGFWGKFGKIALKAAPYAAMAIPGVGIPLGMAIAGASGVASKKLGGSSWKDSLISGGVDAGLAAIPGGKAATGLAPSAGAVAKNIGKSSVKSVLGNMGKNVLTGMGTGGLNPEIGSDMPSQGGIAGQRQVPPLSVGAATPRPNGGGNVFEDAGGGGGRNIFNPRYGMMPEDSSAPNLSYALNQGKMQALKSQPWREERGIFPQAPKRRAKKTVEAEAS